MSRQSVLGRLVSRIVDRRLKCRRSALACLGLEALGVIGVGVGPILLKAVIDEISGHQPRRWALPLLVGFLVAVWTIPSLLSSLRAVYSERINSRLAASLASGAVAGFLGDGVWRTAESGKIQSLVERLPYNLAIVIDGLVWRTAPIALQVAVGLTVILKLTSWKYAVALAAVSAGFIVISWIGMRRHAQAAKEFNLTAGACGALVGDILRNPRRIVSNGAVALEVQGVRGVYFERERAEQRVSWSLVELSAAQWIVVSVGLTTIFMMAAADVVDGRETVGDFVLLQAYALRLVLPLAGVGFILSQSATALGNLAEVLALQPKAESDLPQRISGEPPSPARVEVRDLSFRYPDGRGGVSEVSVDFLPGSFSVVVGKNGAGKSTFAQLLAGLLTADKGAVTYDGFRLDEIPEGGRHHHVLYVPQRVSLLNRDLRANLFYPPSRLNESEALRRLAGWEFIDGDRPADLTASVGEGGEALSGGQVQKLELARLLGVNVPCLILDESTSALNPAIEARIIAELRREIGAKTTLIFVAHREALAAAADQVLWMEGGRLKAVGGHAALMNDWPDYKRLWGIR